jgi:hypothetical protein
MGPVRIRRVNSSFLFFSKHVCSLVCGDSGAGLTCRLCICIYGSTNHSFCHFKNEIFIQPKRPVSHVPHTCSLQPSLTKQKINLLKNWAPAAQHVLRCPGSTGKSFSSLTGLSSCSIIQGSTFRMAWFWEVQEEQIHTFL